MTEISNLIPLESDKDHHSLRPKRIRKKTWIMVAAALVTTALIVGFVIFVVSYKAEQSSKTIDIQWCYNVTLGKVIDESGLEEGVLNKYVKCNLTKYKNGMYRRNFNFAYIYNGKDEETVQSYNTIIEQSRFINIFA
eukprot:126075_1